VSTTNETYLACDRCGSHVADGDGRYIGEYRVCSDCDERESVEAVQLRATLAVINEIMGIKPKKETK
jgi:translation initiation factor 2 beta subunit (eIF-2beta)/eIF-5